MSLEPTPENVIGRWGQCMALALQCAELGLLESLESIDRRRRMAQLALEDPLTRDTYYDLLELLGTQRSYMRDVLRACRARSVRGTPEGQIVTGTATNPAREFILDRIRDERNRQLAKWGVQRHAPAEWISVATEKLGEAAERGNKAAVEPIGDEDPRLQLGEMLRELVQVAAVCVAAFEDLSERFPEVTSRRVERDLEERGL